MKLTKHQKVTSSLADYNANLSTLGAFQIMEDAITEFMGELQIDGLTVKQQYNAVWVFSKTKMEFFKSILWNTEYTVSCFISKITNVTIDIDVAIKNANDELCIYSKTELCALDMSSGRIRKVSTVGVDERCHAEAPLAEIAFSKFDAENLPVVEEIKVRLTSIDYAVHTNNKEYIRFMLNTYTVREMENNPIKEMQVVFANQSYENDLLTLRKGSFGNTDLFAICKEDKSIVKCEVRRAESQAQ